MHRIEINKTRLGKLNILTWSTLHVGQTKFLRFLLVSFLIRVARPSIWGLASAIGSVSYTCRMVDVMLSLVSMVRILAENNLNKKIQNSYSSFDCFRERTNIANTREKHYPPSSSRWVKKHYPLLCLLCAGQNSPALVKSSAFSFFIALAVSNRL